MSNQTFVPQAFYALTEYNNFKGKTASFVANQQAATIIDQYVDMAAGGDGGKLIGIEGEPSCREYNYPGQPDSFFQAVCDGMGWSYLADEHESQ